MAENLTKKTNASVKDFLASVKHERRREDGETLLKLMKKVTGKQAKMWGPSIIGFDEYHYKYDSGHEGDICMIGFSPRAASLSLYMMPGFKGRDALMKKLGKHKIGKGCLYINKLADVDIDILEQIVREAYQFMKAKYG